MKKDLPDGRLFCDLPLAEDAVGQGGLYHTAKYESSPSPTCIQYRLTLYPAQVISSVEGNVSMATLRMIYVDTGDAASIKAAYRELDALRCHSVVTQPLLTRVELIKYGEAHGYSVSTAQRAFQRIYYAARESYCVRHADTSHEGMEAWKTAREEHGFDYRVVAQAELHPEVLRTGAEKDRVRAPRAFALLKMFLKEHGIDV